VAQLYLFVAIASVLKPRRIVMIPW
jgi:hypothetical protein